MVALELAPHVPSGCTTPTPAAAPAAPAASSAPPSSDQVQAALCPQGQYLPVPADGYRVKDDPVASLAGVTGQYTMRAGKYLEPELLAFATPADQATWTARGLPATPDLLTVIAGDGRYVKNATT